MRNLTIFSVILITLVIPVSLFAEDLTGRVIYKGQPVVEKVKVTADRSVCGDTLEKVRLAVDEAGGVADVVVWLEGVKSNEKPEPMKVDLDQKGCLFVPWIIATTVGSKLVVHSSDMVLHNAHGIWEGTSKTAFNVAVPMPGMTVDVTLDQPGRLKVRCDAGHTWMEAYIAVFDHPFFAKTDGKGQFVIKNVPPGNYTLHVWHPVTGEITKSVKVPGTLEVELPIVK